MRNEPLSEARRFARRNRLLPSSGIVLVAVSGGRDSMCLLHYLSALGAQSGFAVAAAHYNHCLRGAESDGDAAFVAKYCAQRGIPCYIGRGDVAAVARQRGETLEEAARTMRYTFLERCADEIAAVRIATAHHAEDNAETILFHLLRGSGVDGLCGIPPQRERLIRPFLTTPRTEIEDYVAANAIPYREDSSNTQQQYTRNYLRHTVMPQLRQINRDAVTHIGNAGSILRAESRYLDTLAMQHLEGWQKRENGVAISCTAFAAAPKELHPRMLRLLLAELPLGKKDISHRQIEAMESLLLRGGTARIQLPHGFIAYCDGSEFRIFAADSPLPPMELRVGQTLQWGDYRLRCCVAAAPEVPAPHTLVLRGDADSVFTVSRWNPRDRMQKTDGRVRSVKRLFVDCGITPEERERCPVLYHDGVLAAVWGIGVDAAFAPSAGETACIIYVEKIFQTKPDG